MKSLKINELKKLITYNNTCEMSMWCIWSVVWFTKWLNDQNSLFCICIAIQYIGFNSNMFNHKIPTATINFQINKECILFPIILLQLTWYRILTFWLLQRYLWEKRENFHVPMALILTLSITTCTYIVVHDSNYILRDLLWYII